MRQAVSPLYEVYELRLSIIATLYRSERYINEFFRRASEAARQLVGDDYEIILVNDDSPDKSLELAINLTEHDSHAVVVDLSRNFGHHKAMMTGLAHAIGELIFLIDSDLEEDPEWLLGFAAQMKQQCCDVVFGVQIRRIGSSYLPGELTAAFLWAQMEEAESITMRRLEIWNHYHQAFHALEESGRLRRPVIPDQCGHNAHMYYLLLGNLDNRSRFIASMKKRGVVCVFHYVPLHDAPQAHSTCGVPMAELPITTSCSDQIVRLPIWIGLDREQVVAITGAEVSCLVGAR